jgi:hypothetical protein
MSENNQLSIIEAIDIQSIPSTMQKISAMQAIVQKTLKRDHDYGIIPGTTKPTLLKPGAEKILLMFGLTSEYEFMDKIEDFKDSRVNNIPPENSNIRRSIFNRWFLN